MKHSTQKIASLVLVIIALFLVFYAWVPNQSDLEKSEGVVANVISQPNTWYEVQITLSNGSQVSCRGRHGWPLIGPKRCPIEKFESIVGQKVSLLHDGNKPFDVKSESEIIVDYSDSQKAQTISFVIAGVMAIIAFLIYRKNN